MRNTLLLTLSLLPAVTTMPSCGGSEAPADRLHRAIDSIDPPVITAPTGGITIAQGTSFVLAGTALPGATVNVYDNGALTQPSATADASGTFSLSVTPTTSGFHVYRCTQTLSGLTSGFSALRFVTVNAAVDTDQDGIVDSVDNCVSTANKDQKDHDQDGIGDVCDRAITTPDASNTFFPEDVYSVAVPISGGGGDSRNSSLFAGYKAYVQLPQGALNSTFDNYTMALIKGVPSDLSNWNIRAYRGDDDSTLSRYLRRINQDSGYGVPENMCMKVRIYVGPKSALEGSLNQIKVQYKNSLQDPFMNYLNNCNGSSNWNVCSTNTVNHCVRAFVDGTDVLAEFTIYPL